MSTELPATVPGPVGPDARAAWYAPEVRSQYHVSDGIVATVTERDEGYHYRTREPLLSEAEGDSLDEIEHRFRDATLGRPRTRAGAVERVRSGLPTRLQDRLPELDRRPASRRRLGYHVLASLRALGPLTPLALDERIRIADTNADRLAVHTQDFAPATTALPDDVPYLDRFLGERVRREQVSFAGFSIPVTIVRGHLLGADTFEVSYVVEEPDRLPGDQELIDDVVDRILESPPAAILEDEVAAVADRARTLLGRRLGYRPLAWAREALPQVLSARLPGRDSIPRGTRAERLDALTYYVLRDLVGDGKLTVPMRDPAVRSIEANRVGDRITVVTHRGSPVGDTRMPTTLAIADDAEFVDLTRSLAAEGGVELSVHRPSATVSLERETAVGRRELHCSVTLPEDTAGHVSITSQRETPPTPIALVERGQLDPDLVAGIWTAAANRGTVLFVGPVDAEPTAAMGAHTPFIPAGDRPVEFGAAAGQVDLPHETAIAVPDRTAEGTRWDQRTERDALHPDVAVLSGLETAAALERLGTIIGSGRPVFAAARAASRSLLSHRVETAGIAHEFRARVALVIELPAPDSDDSATGWVPVTPSDDATVVDWEPLFESRDTPVLSAAFTERLASDPDGPTLDQAFARRRQYVSYLRREGSTDRESLLGFLADLRTDETATIERIGAQER